MHRYELTCLNARGSVLCALWGEWRSDEEAVDEARNLILEAGRKCEFVEVWLDGGIVATVPRESL